MKCVSVVGIGPGNELYLSIAAKETPYDFNIMIKYNYELTFIEYIKLLNYIIIELFFPRNIWVINC